MKTKILMVDDAGSAIELVKSYIEEYEILGAKSGKEMWEVLLNNKPELILMDIILQGEDGYDLARMLSTHERYSEIPVIFISAKNTGKDVLEGLKLDAYDYIKKPFDKFELLARINATLKRKELENRLKERSVRDPLTECFNRKYFYERVKQQISYYLRTETTFSVALIDLDNFKNINDTYGHLAGDYILVEFASLLKSKTRPYDIPVRFGGEEFSILYSDCTKENAAKSIEHIKTALKKSPPVYDGKKIVYTFSCGIAEVTEVNPEKGITFESLIKIADKRMYKGKDAGKDIIMTDS